MKATCKICDSALRLEYAGMFDDRYGYPKVYDILYCENCKSFITYPPLHGDEISSLYSNYYPRKSINPRKIDADAKKWKPNSSLRSWLSGEHRIQRILPVATRPNIKVLDIGCGDGHSLLELEKLGYRAWGIETDTNTAKVRDELGLNIHIGMIENCPFDTNSFDYIIVNQVIEHIVDLTSFFDMVYKFISPDGTIILSTPNAQSIFRKLYGRRWMHWHIPYHQQIPSKKALEIMLHRRGFEITKSITVSPVSWTVHEINRLRFNAKPGLRNPFWTSPETIRSRIVGKIVRKSFFYIMTILGKIADLFGYGNCLIIYAHRKT